MASSSANASVEEPVPDSLVTAEPSDVRPSALSPHRSEPQLLEDIGRSTKRRSGTVKHRITYQPRSHRFARFLFTRRTYRMATALLLILIALLLVGWLILIFWVDTLRNDVRNIADQTDLINDLTAKGLDVSVECEYEGDANSTFYDDVKNWNTELCSTSCGKTAYAFRRNRLLANSTKNNNTKCMDRVDMVPCHNSDSEFCKPVFPSMIKNFLKFCPGKNLVPMPRTQVTANNAMNLSIALFDEKNTYDNVHDLVKLQKDVLASYKGKYLLGQSLVTRCPKCMVNSRCFTVPGSPYVPLLGSLDTNSPLRQLTTLRAGFPLYAQLCDGLEKLTDFARNSETCSPLH